MASGSVEKKYFSTPKNCTCSYTISSGGNARITKTAIGNDDLDSTTYYACIKGFTCGSTSERPIGYVQTANETNTYCLYVENVGTSTTGKSVGLYMSLLPKKYVTEGS